MPSPSHTSRRNEFLARRWQGCSGRWPRSMCLNPPSRARLRRHTASSGQNSGRLLAGRQVTLRLEPTLLHVIADGSCCAPFRSPWRRRGRARLGGVPHRKAIRVPVRQREADGYCAGGRPARASSSASRFGASAAPICWKISRACRRRTPACVAWPAATAQRPRPARACASSQELVMSRAGLGPPDDTPEPARGHR
jgi:hypothetical protein